MVRWLLIAWAALCLLLCGLVAADAIPPPKEGLFPRSPWLLSVAAFFFLFLATSDWIARLRTGAVPAEHAAEMRAQRLAEIAGWLRERVTVEEAKSRVAQDAGKLTESITRAFEDWVCSNSAPGDELWYYDTGGDSWEYLCGEDGFAIVREGRVNEFWMHSNN
jgi:hypothetical protein